MASSDNGTRSNGLERLKAEEFDMVVIGGGATGLGTALDAARRGYSVAVIDRGDWAEGTSSKSSNMHHGGVRYLQAFVRDPTGAEEQLKVVKNGLQEQQYLYHCAPYIVQPCPIMVPCYSQNEVQDYGKLLMKYDELGAEDPYPSSHWCNKSEALFRFPQLKTEGLEGAWVYYDAEQDDARMGLLIALTAQAAGACTVNYVEVKGFVKDESGKVTAVTCCDNDGGEESEPFDVKGKVVINCTGPFSDAVRKMDEPDAKNIIKPAAGTHVVLPGHFSPSNTGMAILETSDGRAMFYLPWQGRTLVGTTDYLADPITKWPKAPLSDINFILGEVNRFLRQDTCKATLKDVLSTWVGIRPLATGTQSVTGTAATEEPADEETKDDAAATKKVSREHIVMTSSSGVITVAGGKWTSYRHMAEDTVDAAVASACLEEKPKKKGFYNFIGCKGEANEPAEKIEFANAAPFHANVVDLMHHYQIDPQTAEKLNQSYGSLASEVCKVAKSDKALRKKISGQYPWIMAQVAYAVRAEHARHATDILSRRTRLCQVDVLAAHLATPKIISVMAQELGWDDERKEKEATRTEEFLNSCGLELRLKQTSFDKDHMRTSLYNFQYGGN